MVKLPDKDEGKEEAEDRWCSLGTEMKACYWAKLVQSDDYSWVFNGWLVFGTNPQFPCRFFNLYPPWPGHTTTPRADKKQNKRTNFESAFVISPGNELRRRLRGKTLEDDENTKNHLI
ncbi:hypothetical protein NC653_023545 [Populus alba x Populus x berolinensis]|uniref:Uncharacterized protein n=1 Tax=Populus alba x Populus x berolinensis TaxID=444605 RepID=A0AAD6MHR0_9ROSI|nr:hypothetical protein NC653_023545 [Populus alba x Populus x berolinensis]